MGGARTLRGQFLAPRNPLILLVSIRGASILPSAPTEQRKKGSRSETPLSAPKSAADTRDDPDAAVDGYNVGAEGQKIKVTAALEATPATATKPR